MPNTAKGTPYVVSTDLVANYPTVSSDLADHIDDNLAYNAVSINAQTGTTYTFALADASEGKLVTASNAASSTYTVPPQSSVTWASGAVLRILNQGAGTVTIAAGSGVTINGTPLTLAQYKGAAIQRTASNTWTFIPFVSGAGNAVITSPVKTGSFTSGGVNYDYWDLTSSTSITVGTAGMIRIMSLGGGGSGASDNSGNDSAGGGGGAGGLCEVDIEIPAGTYTARVGAGASAPTVGSLNGFPSGIWQITSAGGGGGGSWSSPTGQNGASGGGGAGRNAIETNNGGVAAGTTGNTGGTGFSTTNGAVLAGGGGGGANAVGGNAASGAGGAGGAGLASSITGTSVTYGGGGGGGGRTTGGAGGTGGGGAGGASTANGSNGSTNLGGGGGGGVRGTQNYLGGNGGSGRVILRVAV
jgi:hypothetical protein